MTEIRDTKTRPWLGLFAVLTALIMNILDSTIVTVAAPSIRESLGGSYASIQWLSAGYTLALAAGLLTGGRLGDMFGRRRVLLIGVAGFVAASLACAFAPTAAALIGARVLQGLFGAIMVPQGFGLIRDLFPPQQIGKAFGVLGPVIGLSTILGPIVAGVLIDADLAGTGWRAVFLINLPIGAFAFLAGRAALPVAGGNRALRLDVVGMVVAGVGMFLLVYPLVQGREQGWTPSMFAMLGVAVAVLAAFVAYQMRRRHSGRTPLVELSVFTKRSYTSGVIFVIVFFGSIIGLSLCIGLFLQLGLGYSPMRASLTTTGWAAGAFLGSGFAATTMGRLGRKLLHIGLVGMAIGLVGIFIVLSTDVNQWTLLPALLVYGGGMGMIFVPLFDIIMGDIRDHEVGSASSMLESLQQMGASLGVAVLGTVFFSSLGTRPAISDFLSATRTVAAIAFGLVVLAFGLAFLLPRAARAHGAPGSPDPATPIEAGPVLDDPVLADA